MKKKIFIVLIINIIYISRSISAIAANFHTDTISLQTDSISNLKTTSNFHPKQLILPGALIAVGAWGVNNGWLLKLKQDVRNEFEDFRGDCRWHGDDYLQYLPTVAYVSLGLLDTKPRHDFMHRLATGATAYAFMGIMVNATKQLVNEPRPDSGASNSFPSGHTATAFMGAELVRLEYPWPYGLGAYAIAGATAFLRLYNDRHWANDILAGAGMGILSARMAYWMLPLYEKWFFNNDDNKRAGECRIIAPYLDPTLKAGGVTAVCCF